jgi:hypothetical protein
VYVLAPDGDEVRRIENLNPLTGIAVDRDGTVYASELTGDVPIGAVDPSTPVGRVVRITEDGDRSYAAVTLPQGLAIEDGRLYGSALSLVPDGGQAVRSAPAPSPPAPPLHSPPPVPRRAGGAPAQPVAADPSHGGGRLSG